RGVDLAFDRHAKILMCDVVFDDDARDLADPDAAEGDWRANVEAAQGSVWKEHDELHLWGEVLAAPERQYATDKQCDRANDEGADERWVAFLGHLTSLLCDFQMRTRPDFLPAGRPRPSPGEYSG